MPIPYVDIAELPEDDRIEQIGLTAMSMQAGKTIGFLVDDEPGKADRYIAKLLERFPDLKMLSRSPGPVANVETILVTRK